MPLLSCGDGWNHSLYDFIFFLLEGQILYIAFGFRSHCFIQNSFLFSSFFMLPWMKDMFIKLGLLPFLPSCLCWEWTASKVSFCCIFNWIINLVDRLLFSYFVTMKFHPVSCLKSLWKMELMRLRITHNILISSFHVQNANDVGFWYSCSHLFFRFRVTIMKLLQICYRQAFFSLSPWMGQCLFPLLVCLCNGFLDLNFMPLQRIWIGPSMNFTVAFFMLGFMLQFSILFVHRA